MNGYSYMSAGATAILYHAPYRCFVYIEPNTADIFVIFATLHEQTTMGGLSPSHVAE